MSVLSRSGNHHRDALRPWFERYDAISYAREKARWFTRRAGGQLSLLPATRRLRLASRPDRFRGHAAFVAAGTREAVM